MQGQRYLHRTHSTLRPLQKICQLKKEFDVRDTASLVAACNMTRTDHDKQDALLDWIGSYIPFFEKMTPLECCRRAMEFVQLANIVPESTRSKELLMDAFCCLCTKISRNDYGDEKFVQELSHFLLLVDHKAFERNPHYLTRVARDLIKKLGQEATFSRGTYPTHNVSLLTLHHLCLVIHAVDPTEFDHDKPAGLYQEMNRCLESIVDSQSYYPIYYQARLTQQSLAYMDSHPGASSTEKRFRMFCAIKGTMYIFQALASVASANIDIENLEKGVNLWIEACTSRSIKQSSWYENSKPLIDARILVQSDPEKIETFQVCLLKINELQEQTRNKEDQLALRFTMIRQLTLMAIHCPADDVREWAREELFHFGTHYAIELGWAKDPAILEALLDAMLEVHQGDRMESRMERALEKLKLNLRTGEQAKMIENWEEATEWKRANEDVSRLDDDIDHYCLFRRVEKELAIDELISTRLATQEKLKKHYQLHSEVPSLFDNEPCKHVRSLDHSLMAYEKVLGEDEQVHVAKRPLDLGDLFKDRILVPRGAFQRVRRVLLFGNPGTGKTHHQLIYCIKDLIGKTTVAKKIAYKWSVDEWGDMFDVVFLVPIRELGSTKYDDLSSRTRRNLQTAITNICFPGENDTSYEALRLQVEQELDKESTLVMFDGLDEGEESAKEMIRCTKSKSCRVMVLSRPQNLQSERNVTDLEVECMGLSDEQLVHFIEAETLSTEMVEHLQNHPIVWEISHTPVVANILVFLCKTRKEDVISAESNINMSSLYWKMSMGVWTRYVEKTKSDAQRDVIFETLEKIAFHALEDGQILIDQNLVRDHCHDRQTQDVLKDCGFLLLRREGFYYQFPHLTFQEFFVAQYLAHSLMDGGYRRKQEAINFFVENKYCANFRQVFRFMTQVLIERKREKGYLEVQSLVNARPIALGYQQHLLLNLELLEACLSASKPQDRAKILNSTSVLEIAFKWIEPLLLEDHNRPRDPGPRLRGFRTLDSIIDATMHQDQLLELFAKVARVARCAPDQWERVMYMLKPHASILDKQRCVHCIALFIQVIPEERQKLLQLYWAFLDNEEDSKREVAIRKFSDVARLMPNASEQMFEKYESMLMEGKPHITSALLSEGPALAEVMHERWQDILELIIRHADNLPLDYANSYMWSIIRFAENVPESASKVMEKIQEWSVSDNRTRYLVAFTCYYPIQIMPQNAKKIAELLWTLCKDSTYSIRSAAKRELIEAMVSWGEISNPGVNALLVLSECERHTIPSLLVQLFAIAYKWIDKGQHGVDRVLSTLGREELQRVYDVATKRILFSTGLISEKVAGMHRLHLMCLQALHPRILERKGLSMTTDILGSISNEVALMSIKLTIIDLCSHRGWAPMALCQFAINYPEFEEDVFDTLDKIIERDRNGIARRACIQIISVLGKMPQRAGSTLEKCQELMEIFGWEESFKEIEKLPLDALLEAYLKFRKDFLIPFIIWKSYDTPATMEMSYNGQTQLIVQTASNSKMEYTFKTAKEAKAIVSSVRKYTRQRFCKVAPLIPELKLQVPERGTMQLFRRLRDRVEQRFGKIFRSGWCFSN